MSGTPSIIPAATLATANLSRPEGVERALRNIFNGGRQPLLQAQIDYSDSVASGGGKKRTFTIQVVSRDQKPCRGQYLLAVVCSTTIDGAPSGVQTTAWVTGAVVATLTADQVWHVYTDTEGVADLEVTVVGATDRFIRATVLGVAHGTDAVDFT